MLVILTLLAGAALYYFAEKRQYTAAIITLVFGLVFLCFTAALWWPE